MKVYSWPFFAWKRQQVLKSGLWFSMQPQAWPQHPSTSSELAMDQNISGWWARATPLKNMSSSIGMMRFPILMGTCQIHGNQTTNQPSSSSSSSSSSSGWWLGHPSEKYEFVNWDDDSNPLYEWENAKFMATKPPTRYYATFLEGWTSTCQLSWRYGFEFSPASQGSVSAFGSSMEYRRNPGILAIWAETLKHRFYSKKIRKKMLDMNCGSTSQSCFQNHLGILISPMHLPEKDLPEPTIQSNDP